MTQILVTKDYGGWRCGAAGRCWPPVWALAHILAALLLIQFSAHQPGKAAEDSQVLGPLHPGGRSERSSWLQTSPVMVFGGVNQWIENVSLPRPQPLALSNILKNRPYVSNFLSSLSLHINKTQVENKI